jgi:hypothetical protein
MILPLADNTYVDLKCSWHRAEAGSKGLPLGTVPSRFFERFGTPIRDTLTLHNVRGVKRLLEAMPEVATLSTANSGVTAYELGIPTRSDSGGAQGIEPRVPTAAAPKASTDSTKMRRSATSRTGGYAVSFVVLV